MLAAADLGGRTGKILQRFPTFMLAPSPDKALAAVAAAIGHDLDEADRLAMGIQRAYRLEVADEAVDVLRLAALAALHPADFFILTALYANRLFADRAQQLSPEPLADPAREQLGYDAYVDALRHAATRMIGLLMEGCGTVWSLLEGTAALIDAQRLGADGELDRQARVIETLDADPARGGFIHRLAIRHHIVEDDAPAQRDGFVYVVENPRVDRDIKDAERRQRERFRITRAGFFGERVTVHVTGTAGRTVQPMIINLRSHEGVGYAGVLADGQRLSFTADGSVLLDGVDVTAKAFHFRGALADDSIVDGTAQRDLAVVSEPPGALDRNLPRAPTPAAARLPVLELDLGDTDWRFSVREGAFDAASFDEAVYALPDDPAQLAALPPSGRVQLAWREHEPFAVTVLIPSALASLQGMLSDDLPTLVRAGLERFRSAGVRLDVRYFDEDWVLGRSVLESLDAAHGSGVDFDATIPIPS